MLSYTFRYPEQESYPINLMNGSYYYIEALHKEQYGNDSLTVAVKTPDNKFYAPIPSQFLWTQAPHKEGMAVIRINKIVIFHNFIFSKNFFVLFVPFIL